MHLERSTLKLCLMIVNIKISSKRIVTIITKQSTLLNGNGKDQLLTGGKDIKVPKYTVKPLSGGEEYDIDCKSDDLDEYLKKNGLVKVIKFPGIVSHQGSLLSKTDNGWKDVLKSVKKASGKGNTIKV